jgi:catechol 2,3-dioxygenase-like lactoylglutathione lyase family enzyme
MKDFKLGMNALFKPAYREAFVALASLQIARQVDFYSALLASEPTLQTASYAEFCLLGLRLALFVPKADHRVEFAAAHSGAMSLCLEVPDLQRTIAHLKTLGYAPPGEIIYSTHGQEIYAYDPDGNRIILHQST